ncbi:MAG: type II secretion system protein [Patescibacteria group bacterium]|jgi:prepilin-type N-terminal cleavage/methylation domain-containing protein|nr:type II secretion system protein [Patescibacteria group bacterium]
MFFKNNQRKGFTLVELMLVVAIIGILAGIVMVSLSGIRDKGEDSKILAELSATIQPMITCWSDGHQVFFPSGSGSAAICSGFSEYGTWPRMDEYYTDNTGAYQYNNGALDGNAVYYDSNWSFFVQREDGSSKICCNKRNKSCAIIPEAEICTYTLDLTTF